jgi:transcriptional regulator with XRE-family HTH domain
MPRRATTALSVGGRLRALRLARGLSQEALSQASGVSATIISRIERGAIVEPSLGTLRALSRALDVTLDELAGEDDPGSAKSRRGGHG